MIGPLEIVIIVVVLLVLFGGYKKLPELGRRAGSGARVGGEKAKELADKVGEKGREKAGDRIDPASMGRSAGKHVRDAREFRDSFKGSLDASPSTADEAKPSAPAEATPAPAAEPPTEPQPASTKPEGESAPATEHEASEPSEREPESGTEERTR